MRVHGILVVSAATILNCNNVEAVTDCWGIAKAVADAKNQTSLDESLTSLKPVENSRTYSVAADQDKNLNALTAARFKCFCSRNDHGQPGPICDQGRSSDLIGVPN
jgi:hypothetical protein